MLHGARKMTAEEERVRLIGEIARVLGDGAVPEEARKAALTFIGWLARRMPGEPVSRCDLRLCKGIVEERTSRDIPVPSPPGVAVPLGPASGPKPLVPYVEAAEYSASGVLPRSR
jgi:hypothetical protein